MAGAEIHHHVLIAHQRLQVDAHLASMFGHLQGKVVILLVADARVGRVVVVCMAVHQSFLAICQFALHRRFAIPVEGIFHHGAHQVEAFAALHVLGV